VSLARVALIGARRERQGLGPFVARDLAALDVEIAAVLGTREETVEVTLRDLGDRLGLRPRGYTAVDELLAREPLDALVILSPSRTHESHLRAALDAGLHVLCEKPLIWGGDELAARGAALVEAFAGRRLLLAENCQWPWTLHAFRELHPDACAGAPQRFGMLLSPASSGLDRIGDCLPHAFSLLQALAPHPRPRLEEPELESLPGEPAGLRVRFAYRAGPVRIRCDVELRPAPGPPRPAALEIDGHRAERRIQLPEYAMELRDGERSVPLPDPLTARLGHFVRDLETVLGGSAPPDPAPLAHRLDLLEALVEAYRAQVGAAHSGHRASDA
jgi:predicted dehydrogenase